MSTPIRASSFRIAAASVDFPDAGRPVTQIAKGSIIVNVFLHAVGLEARGLEHAPHESEKFPADFLVERRIPDRACHDEPAEGEEGRRDLRQLPVARLLEVPRPESTEEIEERALVAPGGLEREEKVVHR